MADFEMKRKRVLDRDFIFDIFSNKGFPENATHYFSEDKKSDRVMDNGVQEEGEQDDEPLLSGMVILV